MSCSVGQSQQADLPTYRNIWEHLSDELRCVDLRLRQQVLKQTRLPPSDPLSSFKGLIITDTEIADLFAYSQGATGEPVSELAEHQKLESALADLQNEIEARRFASRQGGVNLSLPRLADIFGLTQFEEQCLVICLAPEVDRKYEKVFAYLQDDATRRKPSIDLVLNLLCASQAEKLAARAAFDPCAALFRFKLLQTTDAGSDGPMPLLSRTLKLDDRIVNALFGHRWMDARLERFVRMGIPRPP